MTKYSIDKSFGIAARFNPPFNKGIVFASRAISKNAVKCLQNRDDMDIQTETINVSEGTIDIHILIPGNSLRQNPCLFYIHGGGFAYDAQAHQFKNAAAYALKTNSIVIIPHYILTPAVSAPVLLNDCLASWEWMLANAERYKIDLTRIGIGGDSAGGYLASKLVNLVSYDRLKYQMLVYPVIDSAMRTASMAEYTDTPMWNAKNNRIMWEWYDSGKNEISLLDEELSCAIPPTYIETAEFDCLHDEGILYSERLKKAGVKVTVNETRGTMHGFDIVDCPITKKAVSKRIQFIQRQIW